MEKKNVSTLKELMEAFEKDNIEQKKRWAEADKRWAEADRRWAEADRRWAEVDKRNAEAKAEADRRKAEANKRSTELDEKFDKVYKTICGVSDNAGHHAEQYFQNVLAYKLSFGQIKYDYMQPNVRYKRKGEHAEFDIVLFNGNTVAIIEAKNRIHPDFIKEIAEKKVAQFRKYFPLYKNHALYLGVAGFSFDESVEQEAKKYGVGIIRQVGDAIEMDDKNLKVY